MVVGKAIVVRMMLETRGSRISALAREIYLYQHTPVGGWRCKCCDLEGIQIECCRDVRRYDLMVCGFVCNLQIDMKLDGTRCLHFLKGCERQTVVALW